MNQNPNLVRGLGVGVVVNDIVNNSVAVCAAIEEACANTRASWYQTWTPSVPCAKTTARFAPATESGGASVDGWTLEAGANSCWIVLNEPESGVFPNVRTPKSAHSQASVWLYRMLCVDKPFAWVAPNSNINDGNLDWFQEFARMCELYGDVRPSAWGIHVYGWPIDAVNHHWERFWRWWRAKGKGIPVVVTEFGAGPGATAEQNAAVIEWMAREMIDKPVVVAACFFAYQDYIDANGQRYVGLKSDRALLETFNAWASKINRTPEA